MEPVRLGIIGCGIAARELHWPALEKMADRFRIAVVCNHSEPKAKSFAGLVGGVPYVLDYHEVLARGDVDAVSIILPFGLNRRVTEEAASAGKHVMLEKPIAATLDDALELVRLEKKTDVRLIVAENFRYRQLYSRTAEIIAKGTVGNVYAVIWNFFTNVTSAANIQYLNTRWRLDDATYPGGFIIDGGVHITAAIHDLFGEIATVSARTACINPDAGKIDTMLTDFTTRSGVAGTINMLYSSKGLRANSLHIFGDKGTLVVDSYGDSITTFIPESAPKTEIVDKEHGYTGEYENFFRAIRFGEPVVSTLEKAYRDYLVLVKAIEAGKTGTTITL
ncbi:MAG: Gfo/Idh/MocA family oxidoreductase [Candidatus Latescibacterota bacterium]